MIIIDDHPVFRAGMRQLLDLEPALEVVAEASNGEDGIQLVARHHPDIVLLDLNMRGMGGLKTLGAIKSENQETRVVILTVSDTSDELLSSIRAGADGYLLKDMEPEELLAHIKLATSGGTVIANVLVQRLVKMLREETTTRSRNISDLTVRERQILPGLIIGKSNKLIARDLDITEGTVKVHVKHLLRKLNFRSRSEAAAWLVKNKVL